MILILEIFSLVQNLLQREMLVVESEIRFYIYIPEIAGWELKDIECDQLICHFCTRSAEPSKSFSIFHLVIQVSFYLVIQISYEARIWGICQNSQKFSNQLGLEREAAYAGNEVHIPGQIGVFGISVFSWSICALYKLLEIIKLALNIFLFSKEASCPVLWKSRLP